MSMIHLLTLFQQQHILFHDDISDPMLKCAINEINHLTNEQHCETNDYILIARDGGKGKKEKIPGG